MIRSESGRQTPYHFHTNRLIPFGSILIITVYDIDRKFFLSSDHFLGNLFVPGQSVLLVIRINQVITNLFVLNISIIQISKQKKKQSIIDSELGFTPKWRWQSEFLLPANRMNSGILWNICITARGLCFCGLYILQLYDHAGVNIMFIFC